MMRRLAVGVRGVIGGTEDLRRIEDSAALMCRAARTERPMEVSGLR